jgi:hypothetical protein
MPIKEIRVNSDSRLWALYDIRNDTLDNTKHIESILSRVQSKSSVPLTFELRQKDGIVWKYNIKQSGKKIGAVYVQFASKNIVAYTLSFFWDIAPPIKFTFINWSTC